MSLGSFQEMWSNPLPLAVARTAPTVAAAAAGGSSSGSSSISSNGGVISGVTTGGAGAGTGVGVWPMAPHRGSLRGGTQVGVVADHSCSICCQSVMYSQPTYSPPPHRLFLHIFSPLVNQPQVTIYLPSSWSGALLRPLVTFGNAGITPIYPITTTTPTTTAHGTTTTTTTTTATTTAATTANYVAYTLITPASNTLGQVAVSLYDNASYSSASASPPPPMFPLGYFRYHHHLLSFIFFLACFLAFFLSFTPF